MTEEVLVMPLKSNQGRQPDRILVFAPHPDDDILGCGGSLARHVAEGDKAAIVYMTSGEAGAKDRTPDELLVAREAEAEKAAGILGIRDLTFLHLPDGGIEVLPEILSSLVSLLRAIQPHIVYLPHARDVHRDHLKTHELIMEACRRAGGPWHPGCGAEPWRVPTLLAYEVWSPIREIHHVQDITPFINIKLAAMKKHASQLAEIAYDDAIQGLNRYRGVTTGGGDYCECFQILRA